MINQVTPNESTRVVSVESEYIKFERQEGDSKATLVVQLKDRQAYLERPESLTLNDLLDINYALTEYNEINPERITLIRFDARIQGCFDFNVTRQLVNGSISAYAQDVEPQKLFTILCRRNNDDVLESPIVYLVRTHAMVELEKVSRQVGNFVSRSGETGEGGQLVYISKLASIQEFQEKYPLPEFKKACQDGVITVGSTRIEVPQDNLEAWYRRYSVLPDSVEGSFDLELN